MNNDNTCTFYYTFGSASHFPYTLGWVEVHAKDYLEAHKKFRAHFPDRTPRSLHCAGYYRKSEFKKTTMYVTGNGGEFCHEVIW